MVFDSAVIKSFSTGDKKFDGKKFERLTIGIPTRRCHCLCLSKRKAAPELYEKFKADVCLEIHVDALVMILEDSLGLMGAEILAKPVEYIDINPVNIGFSSQDVVFVKDRAKYEDEEEFRIAIFYPYDEKTEIRDGLNILGDHDFIQLHAESMTDKHPYIINVMRKDGT